MKIDETSRRILNILQERGSITNAELAGIIGLAPATVFERVKKLEKSGIISNYVALVEPQMVGKAVIAFVFITMNDYTQATIQHLSEEISRMPEVLECYRVSGDRDYLLKVVADDIPGYDAFVFNKLARLQKVGKFSSMFVLSTVKHQTKIELEESVPASGSEDRAAGRPGGTAPRPSPS
jgi:Lrp/AsnC family leucine-responsive transcriptional regulator